MGRLFVRRVVDGIEVETRQTGRLESGTDT
jgi:hypothetical protein